MRYRRCLFCPRRAGRCGGVAADGPRMTANGHDDEGLFVGLELWFRIVVAGAVDCDTEISNTDILCAS